MTTIARVVALLVVLLLPALRADSAPPYSGTIFIDPNVITSADPTTLLGVSAAGQGQRKMYDRRVEAFVDFNAHLFNAVFDDGLSAEIQVNPEFTALEAETEAQKYAVVIGRLPTALRVSVKTVWIHRGINPFGGGNNNLLIHTGQSELYEAAGILEETFVHEATHTSLDAVHGAAPGWIAAQSADPEFISTYARDNPTREDLAESFLPYLAVRYRASRIPQALLDIIKRTIPNRIAYLDAQPLAMHPIAPPAVAPAIGRQ